MHGESVSKYISELPAPHSLPSLEALSPNAEGLPQKEGNGAIKAKGLNVI